MKKIAFILSASLLFATAATAQEQRGVCGTSFEDQMLYEARLLANIEKSNAGTGASDRGAIQYIPVHFHLVGDAAGNGKVRESLVLDQLCALNTAFALMDFRFYLRPHPTYGTIFNYNLNNNNIYTNQSAWTTMNAQRHPNAMNMYIVDVAVPGGSPIGITLAYYSPTRDWVVCRRDQISGVSNNSTLAHELGHFYSLQHTFLGWESKPFDSTFPGWPIAPAISPGGSPTELVNQTNCTVAADKLCDTPPDYNFGYGSQTCTYSGGAKDPNGTLVDPMENNMMGYFNYCTSYAFTPQQRNAVIADRATSARNYLNNTFVPVATQINTPADLLISPVNSATTPFYDEVLFQWKAVAGATYYLLETDIVTSFGSPSGQSHIVTGTSKLLTNLLPNRTYFWRVRPFNEYVTCPDSRMSSFKTPTTSGVPAIEGLTALQLAPNPVREGSTTKMFLQTERGFEADLHIFDLAGRTVFSKKGLRFSEGEHTVELPVGNLENGMYTLVVQAANAGATVRKLSILK
ncbi:MAG: T9SS type A sorting domain-containing protein [Saprospiraceae bacterium]